MDDVLRKAKTGTQNTWTRNEIKQGFEYFKKLYNRYPTAHEIDKFPYLPSARSIQRAFGGLISIRKELLPNEIFNFTTGHHRSRVAKQAYANSKTLEEEFYNYLITHFDEIAVHEHKVIRPGSVSSDFYIYLDNESGVVIDIFYADDIFNLIGVINIKLKRYSLIVPDTFLVIVGNPEINQNIIDLKIHNRKLPIPPHISIVTDDYFRQQILPLLKKRSLYSKH